MAGSHLTCAAPFCRGHPPPPLTYRFAFSGHFPLPVLPEWGSLVLGSDARSLSARGGGNSDGGGFGFVTPGGVFLAGLGGVCYIIPTRYTAAVLSLATGPKHCCN